MGGKSPILDSSRDIEQPLAQPLLKDFGFALRRIEERLDDIDARIVALTELPPPSIAEGDAPRAKATERAPHETSGSEQNDARDIASAATAPLLHAPPRTSFDERVDRTQINLTLWRKQRDRLEQVYQAAAHLLAKVARRATDTRAFPWAIKNLMRFGAGDDRLEGIFGTRSTLVLALVGSLLFLGASFLLMRPKAVDTAQNPPVFDQTRELHALNARDAAMVKRASSPAPVEIKVNSLQTSVALLSPKPISGGVSGASSGLAPSPGPADPSDSTAPQPEPAAPTPQSPAQSEADQLDAQAAAGDAAAQYDYATALYKSGDTKGAVLWLEKSAKQGNPKAQLQLGNLYLKGNGVARNFLQARKWLETAANNGDARAMHNLAVLYSGSEGRRPDLARASEWFRRAAEQGVVDSMVNLGLAYSDGLGVERDTIQAYAWFSLAASRGDAKAAQKRRELGKFLSRDELSEAKTLADSLKLAQQAR